MLTRSRSDSVGNLEHVALFRASAAGTHDATERARDPPLLADHLADVVRRDMEMEDDRVLTLFRLDTHGLGIVDESAREKLEKLGHLPAQRRPPRARVVAPTAHSENPAALMRRDTGCVGWAPFAIQSLIFASSRSIVDGSV